MNRCIFLDRDGVINRERGEYTYQVLDFEIEKGVIPILQKFKKMGYLLIIITNQGGINKGIYTSQDVYNCHEYFQKSSGDIIDDIFYSPYHDNFTRSLSRKPDSLMLERAIYKWNVNTQQSWMIGDSKRDLLAGKKVNLKSLYIGDSYMKEAEKSFDNSALALQYIMNLLQQ